MKTDEFTKQLLKIIIRQFPNETVTPEWNVAQKSKDDFNNKQYYAPRVDIAIGPFNIDRNLSENNDMFRSLITQNNAFIQKLYKISHLASNSDVHFEEFISESNLNLNPRCFIAIEIENTKAAKRALGDIVNAAGMGKVGIVVPLGEDKYKMFIKIIEYFNFLKGAKKLDIDLKNVLIIEGHKLLESFNNENN